MNRREFAISGITGGISSRALAAQQAAGGATAAGTSTPQLFRVFAPLKPGSVRPEGWLARYVDINAGGWVLAYAKAKMPEVYGRYTHRTANPDLGFTDHDEWVDAPDYGAYFGDGLVHYAQLRPGSEAAAYARDWVAELLGSQDRNGYIGAFVPEARWRCWLEIFSQAVLLNALLYRYEATGAPEILAACERSAGLIIEVWRHPPEKYRPGIFSGHGSIVIRPMRTLYGLTGNEIYRQFAREVLDRHGQVKAFLGSANAIAHGHNAVQGEHAGFPADVYECTGDAELLKASKAAWQMMQPFLAIDGTPYGNEVIYNTGSRVNCEHCGAVEWMITSNVLARVTGEVKYADAVERAMYNGYPAPKSPDGMTVGYMHSPNQLIASEWSGPHDNDGDQDWWASRQHYSTAHEPLCCNANGPRGLPFFIEAMAARTGQGLVVTYYGPCTVETALPQAGQVRLGIDTAYPFEDEVRISVDPEREGVFPLRLRIPGWCAGAAVEVNGKAEGIEARPGTFAVLDRRWTRGDRVVLRFDHRVRLVWRKRPEFRVRERCAAIERGPLVYSLPVAEDWRQFEPPAHGPGRDIKAYRLFPKQDAAWNYALLIDDKEPERSVVVTRNARALQRPWAWEAPVALEVKARRVLNWRMEGDPEHPRTPGFPFSPMQLADQVETVRLVPFGCTRLRMTYLPVLPI